MRIPAISIPGKITSHSIINVWLCAVNVASVYNVSEESSYTVRSRHTPSCMRTDSPDNTVSQSLIERRGCTHHNSNSSSLWRLLWVTVTCLTEQSEQSFMQTYQQCRLWSMCRDTTTEQNVQFTNDSKVQTIQTPATHHRTVY